MSVSHVTLAVPKPPNSEWLYRTSRQAECRGDDHGVAELNAYAILGMSNRMSSPLSNGRARCLVDELAQGLYLSVIRRYGLQRAVAVQPRHPNCLCKTLSWT